MKKMQIIFEAELSEDRYSKLMEMDVIKMGGLSVARNVLNKRGIPNVNFGIKTVKIGKESYSVSDR